jgi:plasmid stabilization system protein ParE
MTGAGWLCVRRRSTHFVAPRSLSGARHILEAIQAAAQRLQRCPEFGRPGQDVRTRGLVLPDYPDLLIYRVEGNSVIVLRVYRTARDR